MGPTAPCWDQSSIDAEVNQAFDVTSQNAPISKAMEMTKNKNITNKYKVNFHNKFTFPSFIRYITIYISATANRVAAMYITL